MTDPRPSLGRVLGTEDATPLEFWFAVDPTRWVQLDDVVTLHRSLPGEPEPVAISGVVSQIRARHEGATFPSDVFLIADGILPAEVSEAAQVTTTRFEPERYVAPLPGTVVERAEGADRDSALFFDQMERRLPIGTSRDGQPVFVDVDFIDGSRGAHVNISGISGVATKTSYATFLLYSLFNSGVLGPAVTNTRALIFNVKGEDLLFLDRPNTQLDDQHRERYAALGLPTEPFGSVTVLAPPRRGDANAAPDVANRHGGVRSFFWTIEQFCRDELLPFLFADAEDDRQQYTMVVHNVTRRLADARDVPASGGGGVSINGKPIRTFRQLVDRIEEMLLETDGSVGEWAGRAIGAGTVSAFIRRLAGAVDHVGHLIRADVPQSEAQRFNVDGARVTVVDLHNLHHRAQRFVVGVALRTMFREKEAAGTAEPLQFVVLDELNKYAPREGTSPIKEIILDVAERGRSLGIILIGAQQTASEVERRVVSNSAIRVVGRLDPAEAGRTEYGFLPTAQRQRSTIIKPGTMIVSQPQIPVPLVIEFPFPAWATRPSEAGSAGADVVGDADPFDRVR